MRPTELALLYLIATAMVAVLLHQRGRSDWMTAAMWPLTLPGLLARTEQRFDTVEPSVSTPDPIARLQAALALLEVRTSVQPLGEGLRELDARTEALAALLRDPELRSDNQEALGRLHARLVAERALTLDRIDDLVTAIHLAHYGGQRVDAIDEQLADLLAMVEGVAEVRWIP
jgi:hypothetical protein